jgi:acyl carrier protein
MPDSIEQGCLRIFREMMGLAHIINVEKWGDARLLVEPLDAIDVDSLTLLEFVMQIEDAYGVDLDEAAVDSCDTISELSAIIAEQKARPIDRSDVAAKSDIDQRTGEGSRITYMRDMEVKHSC